MKRLVRFLFGCAVGAAAAALVTPKTGREWREQLFGGEAQTLLTSGIDEMVEDTPITSWQPVVVVPIEDEEAALAPEGEDLRTRIEATRSVIETELAQPFQTVPQTVAPEAPEIVAEEPVVEPEPVALAEPEPEPVAVAEPEPEPVAEPESDIDLLSADAASSINERQAWAAEDDSAETTLISSSDSSVGYEPEPEAEAEAEAVEVVEPEPEVEAVVEPEPEAEAEPAEVVEPEPEPEAEAVEVVEPEPEAEAEPVEVVEPEPEAEAEAVEVVEPEPEAEAEPAEVAEPEVADEVSEASGEALDQAEMRRRIEETRARLKAKAFDAMMSGEAALLSRDSGDKPVTRDISVDLDGDVESEIEGSLSPEDY